MEEIDLNKVLRNRNRLTGPTTKKRKRAHKKDREFEKMVATDFHRAPRDFNWHYASITRYLSRYDDAVLKAVMCLTWGWSVAEKRVSLRLIATLTGIHQRNVVKALNRLINYHIISKGKDTYGNNLLRIQANPFLKGHEWRVPTKDSQVASGGCLDFAKLKVRKLFPTSAEALNYKEIDRWEESGEID